MDVLACEIWTWQIDPCLLWMLDILVSLWGLIHMQFNGCWIMSFQLHWVWKPSTFYWTIQHWAFYCYWHPWKNGFFNSSCTYWEWIWWWGIYNLELICGWGICAEILSMSWMVEGIITSINPTTEGDKCICICYLDGDIEELSQEDLNTTLKEAAIPKLYITGFCHRNFGANLPGNAFVNPMV